MHDIVRGTARRVLSIGTPDGAAASAIEEALAPDGLLIVMEDDPGRAEEARRRFHDAKLGARATVIAGDPRRMLYKLAGPFDVILCAPTDPGIQEEARALLASGGVWITGRQTHDP
jgi:predicted O-methyltransferase YrrM